MIPKTYKCKNCNKEYEIFQEKATGYKCPICGKDCAWLAGLGTRSGDTRDFWSLEFGKLGKQRKEYLRTHPDAEFNKFGAMKVHGYKHAQKLMKENGMVELSDSREYRDGMKEERDKALEMPRDKSE